MAVYFERPFSSKLIDFINENEVHKNVLILQGARQVGKSTLLKHILTDKPHLFLNLERSPSIAEHFDQTQNFDEFGAYLKEELHWNQNQQILVIDEAQQSQKLGSYVRFMKEEWQNATVILSGSLISELHQSDPAIKTRRPVGRETFLTLWPMSFKEFLMALGQDSLVKKMSHFQLGESIGTSTHERFLQHFNEYLEVGGLPEVVAFYMQKKDFRRRRLDIFKTYEDDFVRYFSLEDVNLFKRCMEAVADNIGSPSKDTQAIRLDGPGYKRVAGIFSRLEKWKLMIKAEQIGREPEKNKFHPKRYLYDVGILHDLRLKGLKKISIADLTSPLLRTPLGGIIENTLAISLNAQFESVFGIRLGQQSEIDFGVECENEIIPIECKMNFKCKENYLLSLETYLKQFQGRQGILFYGGPPLEKKINSCYILPYYLVDELKRLWLAKS